MAVRVFIRSITLSRSRSSAFLPSLSRVGGIGEYADSIAISFASTMLIFIDFNSRSIFSNVRFDMSFSNCKSGRHFRRRASLIQRRSNHIDVLPDPMPLSVPALHSEAVVRFHRNRRSDR